MTRSTSRRLARLAASVLAALTVACAPMVLTAPNAAASPAAGRVVKSETIAAADLPPGAASGHRITYVTRDQNDRMALATGTYFVPTGTKPAGGWRIFSWAHGTVGIADDCAPSRTKKGTGTDSAVISALKHGYAVTATDYAGLGSAGETEYLGGLAAARSVIDIIRAARSQESTLSSQWVSVGHSQGGHAALFAGHEAPSYAPELQLHRIVALAPASGLEKVLDTAFNPHIPSLSRINAISAPFLYLLAGLDHARPDLGVANYLSEDGKRYLDLARAECNGEVTTALRSVAPGSLLKSSLDDDALEKGLRDYAAVPTSGYTVPIRIDHGLLDPVVPYPLTALLVRSMTSAGTDVDLHTHARDSHTNVVDDSLGQVMDDLTAAFGRS